MRRQHGIRKPFTAMDIFISCLLGINIFGADRIGMRFLSPPYFWHTQVTPCKPTIKGACIHDIRIFRVHCNDSTLTSRRIIPWHETSWFLSECVLYTAHETALVLHGTNNVVWRFHVVSNIVKLCGGNTPEEILPFCATIVRQDHTTIITIDNVIAVGRINPECMVIAMGGFTRFICCAHHIEGLTTVNRFGQWHTHDIHHIFIVRVYPDLSEYPSICTCKTLQFIIFRTHLSPVLSFIFTPVYLNTIWNYLYWPAIRVQFPSFGVTLRSMVIYICINHTGITLGKR